MDEDELCLETAQADLIRFLGEKLEVIQSIGPKTLLENVNLKVLEAIEENNDEWLEEIGEESKRFLSEYKERDLKMQNLDFEEDFMDLDPKNSLKIIVWFIMWLGKIHVKPEFISDLVVICSRIWKVIKETRINVQDLDNKLVWKRVARECEELEYILSTFKKDSGLLAEFARTVCQLIGKVFEEK